MHCVLVSSATKAAAWLDRFLHSVKLVELGDTTRNFALSQLVGIGWGFVVRLGWDLAWGKLSEHEVDRARELREIVTSLGPAYIKLGQALSIRPDILSPAAMYEMQKLCDKVGLRCKCSG